MASSSGSSRGFLRRNLSRLRLGALAVLGGGAVLIARAETPDYLRAALHDFNPGMPASWAYTLTTVRNNRAITERYDPTRPPAGKWSLLEMDGRPPSAAEQEKYLRARTTGPGGTQANFTRADIDPGSLTLVQEDADHAEFTAAFREAATGADKMLGHLTLRLKVDKHRPHIVSYALELKEPYSPVLGVNMNELRVEVRFSPPAEGRPSLPLAMTSHFAGRIFFIPTGEDLRLTYRDHSPAPTELSR